ncbi:MAG: PKD domain-containing protein, partial [Planctomycetota bacterium]
PQVDAGPDATIDEGDTFVSAGSFTDPGDDTWTATVDYGEGAGPQPLALNPDGTFALDNTYENDGVFVVTVTVSDDDGGVGSDSATVTVDNISTLAVDAGPDATINEGDTFVSAGSFTDPGASSWTATVDYDEGAGAQSLALNPDKSFALGNTYEENGVYTVKVTVTGDDGGVDSDSAQVTVLNVAPLVDAGPDQTVNQGDPVHFNGSFTDPGTEDTHTIVWNFGDGSPPVTGTMTPGHTYTGGGIFTVTVTVTDDDGGVGSDSLVVTVEGGTQPEPPISDLTARAKDSKIDLVWAPMPASGYNVYRATTQGGPYTQVATNHQCTYCVFADFGLTNGTTYYYVVTWLNAAGESAISNEASATPQARSRRR